MASLLLIYKNHPNRRAWFRANRGGLMKTNTEGKLRIVDGYCNDGSARGRCILIILLYCTYDNINKHAMYEISWTMHLILLSVWWSLQLWEWLRVSLSPPPPSSSSQFISSPLIVWYSITPSHALYMPYQNWLTSTGQPRKPSWKKKSRVRLLRKKKNPLLWAKSFEQWKKAFVG